MAVVYDNTTSERAIVSRDWSVGVISCRLAPTDHRHRIRLLTLNNQ